MIKKEILKDIKDYIIKNEGITLDIKTLKNTTLKSGYIVSLQDFEYKTRDIQEVINKITNYIDIINTLNNKEKIKKMYFVGVWYNKDDNNYYLDISKHFEKLRDAKKFGEVNKQKAIYNLKEYKEIRLNYNITFYSLYKVIKDNNNIIKDEIIKSTFDNIKDISKYLNITIQEVYNILNNKINLDNINYRIYKDTININEL